MSDSRYRVEVRSSVAVGGGWFWDVIDSKGNVSITDGAMAWAPDEATARDIAALVVARLENKLGVAGALAAIVAENQALRAELEALRERIEAKAKAYDAEAERWGRRNGRMIPETRAAEFRALLTPEVPHE